MSAFFTCKISIICREKQSRSSTLGLVRVTPHSIEIGTLRNDTSYLGKCMHEGILKYHCLKLTGVE